MPVITQQDVINSYQQYAGRMPSQAEINQHTGQTVANVDQAARNFFGVQSAPSGGGGGESAGFEFPAFPEIPPYPGLSDEEKALMASQQQLIGLQIKDLNRQNDLNAALFPLQKDLYTKQLQFATELFPKQQAMIEQLMAELQPSANQQEITRLSEERALASLRGEPIPLSAAQQAQLDTIYGEAGRQGGEDLRRFAEEMGAARGLSLADSPIGDVALREARNLYSGLEASKAQASLDLGQSQQVFSEGVRQFQEGLKQQALQNRLALAAGASNQPALGQVNASSTIGALGSTLASLASDRSAQAQYGLGAAQAASSYGIQAAQYGLANRQYLEGINQANLDRMSRERIAGLQRTYPPASPYQPNQTIAGIAAAAPIVSAGIGAIGSYYSTARVKTDITPLDPAEFEAAAEARGLPLDAYDDALTALRDTPITRWRYRWEAADTLPHIGPILELAPPELSRDGLHLELLDYAGLTHAGLKALDRTVRRLEAKVS